MQKHSLNAHFKCLDIIIQKILWYTASEVDFGAADSPKDCDTQLLAIKSNLLLITFMSHLLFYII